MPNTFYPTQLGYLPTGVNGVANTSTLFLGRDLTSATAYDGPGFGAGGRPDYVQKVIINLTERATNGTLTQRGTITINVDDIVSAVSSNSNVPANLNLTLREVAVCDNGTNKRMMILASQTYAAS